MNGLAGLKDWQAMIAGYFIALIIANTDAAPLAVAGSWGVAIMMLLDQASGGQTLSSLINSVRSSAAQSPSVPQVQAGQQLTPAQRDSLNAAAASYGGGAVIPPSSTSSRNNVTGYVP